MFSLRNAVAGLSAGSGALIALVAVSSLQTVDPQLAAAKQEFGSLAPVAARRIEATFDRLEESPDERARIETLHAAAAADPDLAARLQRVHAWWMTCSDDQRANLRELGATPQRWADTVEQEMGRSIAGTVVVLIPSPPERGGIGRRREQRVAWQDIDRFLEESLIAEELSTAQQDLLKGIDPEDQRLARVALVVRSLFDMRGGSPRTDPDAVERVFGAATRHVLPSHGPNGGPGRGRNERQNVYVCISILGSLRDPLIPGFLERHRVEESEVEQLFADLSMSERTAQMLADPADVGAALNAQLNSLQSGTPAGQLAQQLVQFNRLASRIQRLSRDRGPGGPPFGRNGPREDRGRRNASGPPGSAPGRFEGER